MFELRIHGRGGQGVVTAAELLAVAAFVEGKQAQAIPSFGSERTGAPVVSYCRIDEHPIRMREPIVAPDAIIVQDATLRFQHGTFEGLAPTGYLLVNTSRGVGELGIDQVLQRLDQNRVAVVPANALAREHLGRPLPNAALLGGFAALTELVALDAVLEAIAMRFGTADAAANAAAAKAAFRHVAAVRAVSGV